MGMALPNMVYLQFILWINKYECRFPLMQNLTPNIKCNHNVQFLFHIHIVIWQHGSCIHLAMPTKPLPILINSLHPNNVIQLTLYINQCIWLWWSNPIQSCTLHLHLHNKYIYIKILCSFLPYSTKLFKATLWVLNNCHFYSLHIHTTFIID